MKKRTIWTIATIMGLSFLALLYLQLRYIQEMVDMKKEQFDESVNRALYQASRNLELNETLRYLEKDVNETERRSFKKDSIGSISGKLDGSIQQSPILGNRQRRHNILVVRAKDHHNPTLADAKGDDTTHGQELLQRSS